MAQFLTDLAQALPSSVPFVGPEAQERGRNAPFLARLGANEMGFGPSPQAIDAMRDAAAEVWKYADPENHDLKQALAVHHGVGVDTIVVGEGIDALLGYLVRLVVGPGDRVVTSAGAYPTFNFHVAGYGGVLETCAYVDDVENLPNLIDRARETGAKLIYFANPDNPMGSWASATDIAGAIKALPSDTLLILDEAYAEFAPDDAIPPMQHIQPNVIRMRTFSKAYGMAGARVGYAIGAPDLIKSFDKIRNHFGMCRISQAGALAALGDQPYLAAVLNRVASCKTRIGEIAAENGLRALPSATNFVAIDCRRDGDFATAIMNGLIDRGIFVRMPGVAPLNRCIRVSAGPEDEIDRFATALPDVLSSLR